MTSLTWVLLMGASRGSVSRLNYALHTGGQFERICDHPVGMWMIEFEHPPFEDLIALIEANVWGGDIQLFKMTEDESRFTEHTGLKLKRMRACMVRNADDTAWVSGQYVEGGEHG